MRNVYALLMTGALAVCGAETARQADETNIREAVFRCQFTNDASGVNLKGKIFFLRLGEDKNADPSDEFMRRFAGHQPQVRKASACEIGPHGPVDRKTGEAGLVFHVGAIKWISDTVEVEGGFYEGKRSAASYTFTLKKEGGKWKVLKSKLEEIA